MTLRLATAALGLAALSTSICSAQVADLTGAWYLNVEKSKWGDVQKPVSILVTVNHKEPEIKYSGTMVYAGGEDTRTFAFSGAIDGKEYPMTRSFGDGKVSTTRVNPRTTASVFRSNDGRWEENIRTTISRDGKEMRRSIHRKGPEGELEWTEVYERK